MNATTKQSKEWAEDMNKHFFPPKKIYRFSIDTQRVSTSLIRKMQVKITLRSYFIHVIMTIIKKTGNKC